MRTNTLLPEAESPRCQSRDEMLREPLEPLESTLEGTLRRVTAQHPATPIALDTSSRAGSPSPRRGMSPTASPVFSRAALSPRFRAERAILAMAQREISWHGPELWLVTDSSAVAEVRLGPPLRDLPPVEERALAHVQRAIGMAAETRLTGLLVVSDGVIVGPWDPTELRLSKEHVVCISEDAVPRGEPLPALCTATLMATLARYAKRRLQTRSSPPGARQHGNEAVSADDCFEDQFDGYGEEQVDDYGEEQVDDYGDEYDEVAGDELWNGDEGAQPDEGDWLDPDDDTEADSLLMTERLHGAARARGRPHLADARGEGEMERERDDEPLREREPELEDAEGDVSGEDDDFQEDDQEAQDGERSFPEDAAAEPEPGPRADDDQPAPVPETNEEASAAGAPAEGIITADQFVRVARNTWLKTKEPQKAAEQQDAIVGAVQHIVLRQDGTDLRELKANVMDDGAASSATNSSHKPNGSMERRQQLPPPPPPPPPLPAARGKWGHNQLVVAPAGSRIPRTQSSQPPLLGRGTSRSRFTSAEKGGPAGILASNDHLQRLEQLRTRTAHVKAVWQTSGIAEALRAVMKCDDSALALSILQAASDWLPSLQAAECAIALALTRPLLEPGAPSATFATVTTILRAARDRARERTDDSPITGTGGAAAATLAAAKATLLRETRLISSQLDELRVPRGGGRTLSFDEQFAFGQALAVARDAARETWRSLDSEGEAATPRAMPERPAEQVVISSSVLRPSQGCGRRAW